MNVKTFYNSWIPKILDVDAITLYPFIFFRDKGPELYTIKHEMVHVAQIRKLGMIYFYFTYVIEYLKNRMRGLDHMDAYWSISYEVQARALENTRFTPAEISELFYKS